ncbi:MAG: right-handed parallel beta-helix repeat-containing protein [Pseudomonadota bacterium]|nr:right-handed parallel beta-helix repeat-containing protein [Pseudomonadota bacterium]
MDIHVAFLRANVAVLVLAVVASVTSVQAQIFSVSDATGLRNAINAAAPGHEIVLAPGTYNIVGNLLCDTAATAGAPIVVRAATPRTALIRFDALEGFKVSEPHWRFEGLDIEGICSVDNDCEHAFHIFGAADFTVIRDNRVRDFNAQIKSNGNTVGPAFVFPDDALIERNSFYDTRARNTSLPVTKIDVVGGRRWIVRANRIYDFEKAGGNTVSYAAFLKGNSRDGMFERNLVICERQFSGGVRLGLSFGGGGTSPGSICEDGNCTPEHQNGTMRNNVIVNCPADVGIYLNAAANSRIQHNTLYNTSGVDVRYATSVADLRNNLMDGQIRNRDGGTHTSAGNLTQVPLGSFTTWFQAPALANFRLLDGSAIVNLGAAAPLVTDDFCANLRNDALLDIGAVEYDGDGICDTTIGGGQFGVLFSDGFE